VSQHAYKLDMTAEIIFFNSLQTTYAAAGSSPTLIKGRYFPLLRPIQQLNPHKYPCPNSNSLPDTAFIHPKKTKKKHHKYDAFQIDRRL